MSLFESDKLEIGTALDGVMTEVLSQDIRNNGGSGKFTLLGILHTDKKVKAGESSDFYVYRIESIDEIRDYVKNAGSEIYVSFMVPFGLYAKELYPNRANMEFSVIKEDVSPYGGGDFDTSVFIEDKDKVRTNSERYKAVFLEKDNPKVKGGDFDFADKQSLDLTGIVTVKLQLLNRSVEVLRTVTTGGCYSGVSRTDLIRSIVGRQANNIKIDGKPCLDALDICKADNKLPTQQVLLKQTLNVIHLPAELQEKHGGVYSTGLGSYIQKFNGLNTWFVFPLYDTTRYQDASRKAIFYAIRKDKFVESEKTFTRNQGNQYCHILVTGEKVQTDDGESSVISDGVGFRQMSPDKFLTGGLESFIKATEKGPMGLRSKNVTEVINAERLDGVSYAPASEREISVNNFAEYSRVAYRLGSTITFTWNSADPELLYPGMPCKYVYDDAGTPREVYGVVLFVQALTQMDNPTIVSSSSGDDGNEKANEVYSTNCVVGIFAEKMKHGDEKPPTLSDLNVYAEAGDWSTGKDKPVTNAQTTFTPVSGGVYVTHTLNTGSNGQALPGMSKISPINANQLTVELRYWFKKMLGCVPSDSILAAACLSILGYCDQFGIVIGLDFKIKDKLGNKWNIVPFIVGYVLAIPPNNSGNTSMKPKELLDYQEAVEYLATVSEYWTKKMSYATDNRYWKNTDAYSRVVTTSRPSVISTLDFEGLTPTNYIHSRKAVEQCLAMSCIFIPMIDYENTVGNDRVFSDAFRYSMFEIRENMIANHSVLGTDTVTYDESAPVNGRFLKDETLFTYHKSYKMDWVLKRLPDYISPDTCFYVTAACPDVELAEYIYLSENRKVPLASLSDIARKKKGYFLNTFKEQLSKLTIAQVHAALIWDGLEGYSLPDSFVRSYIPNFDDRSKRSPLTEVAMLPYSEGGIWRISGYGFFEAFEPDLDLMKSRGFLMPQNTTDRKLLTRTQKMFLYSQVIRNRSIPDEVALLYSTINKVNMEHWKDKENSIVNKALNKALRTMNVEDIDLGELGKWSLDICETNWYLNTSNFRGTDFRVWDYYPRYFPTNEGLLPIIPDEDLRSAKRDLLRHLSNLLEYGNVNECSQERVEKIIRIGTSIKSYDGECRTSRHTRWDVIRKVRANFSHCWYYGLTKNEPVVSDEQVRDVFT